MSLSLLFVRNIKDGNVEIAFNLKMKGTMLSTFLHMILHSIILGCNGISDWDRAMGHLFLAASNSLNFSGYFIQILTYFQSISS